LARFGRDSGHVRTNDRISDVNRDARRNADKEGPLIPQNILPRRAIYLFSDLCSIAAGSRDISISLIARLKLQQRIIGYRYFTVIIAMRLMHARIRAGNECQYARQRDNLVLEYT